jgi:hypothetical protein
MTTMKKIVLHTILVLGCSTFFVSCLKDKGFDKGQYGISDIGKGENLPKVIEIPQAGQSPLVFALNTLPATEVLDVFEVNLALGVPAKENIEVTLVKNMTLVSDYNTANFTSYEELPANCYSLPASGLKVTIPAGSNRLYLKMNIIKANFDFTKAYALGYSIASVSPAGYAISANFKNMIISVGLKNKYDGLYKMNGTLVDVANAALGPYPDAQFALVTSGPTSVTMYNRQTAVGAWYDVPFHAITSAGAYSVYGGWAPVFNFNATDNLVSVSNYYGNPNPANTRGAVIDVTGINTFTPATKLIKAKYIMTQPSVVPTAPNYRTFFNMTYTYLGPR